MLIWFRTWHDDHRRLWAERLTDGDPATARNNHSRDRRFGWTTPDMHNPTVSPLEFYGDGKPARYVAAGSVRETDDDRRFMTGATPPPTPTANAPQTPPPSAPAATVDDDLPF